MNIKYTIQAISIEQDDWKIIKETSDGKTIGQWSGTLRYILGMIANENGLQRLT